MIAMTTSDTSTTGTARLKSNASSSIANAGQLGRADFVSNAIGFVSASEKKLPAYQVAKALRMLDTGKVSAAKKSFICKVDTLTELEWHRAHDMREV